MVLNKQFGGTEFEGARAQHEQKQPLTGDGEGRASGVLQKAGEVASDIKAFAVQKAHDVRDVAEEKTEVVVKFLKARPIESVVVGAAAGYLLGWLATKAVMKRRRVSRRRRQVYEL